MIANIEVRDMLTRAIDQMDAIVLIAERLDAGSIRAAIQVVADDAKARLKSAEDILKVATA